MEAVDARLRRDTKDCLEQLHQEFLRQGNQQKSWQGTNHNGVIAALRRRAGELEQSFNFQSKKLEESSGMGLCRLVALSQDLAARVASTQSLQATLRGCTARATTWAVAWAAQAATATVQAMVRAVEADALGIII